MPWFLAFRRTPSAPRTQTAVAGKGGPHGSPRAVIQPEGPPGTAGTPPQRTSRLRSQRRQAIASLAGFADLAARRGAVAPAARIPGINAHIGATTASEAARGEAAVEPAPGRPTRPTSSPAAAATGKWRTASITSVLQGSPDLLHDVAKKGMWRGLRRVSRCVAQVAGRCSHCPARDRGDQGMRAFW